MSENGHGGWDLELPHEPDPVAEPLAQEFLFEPQPLVEVDPVVEPASASPTTPSPPISQPEDPALATDRSPAALSKHPTCSPVFNDPSANVVLVSSDDVIFLLHRSNLCAMSETLRELLDASVDVLWGDPVPEARLDEPADVLEVVFGSCYAQLSSAKDLRTADPWHLLYCARAASKYQCNVLLELVVARLELKLQTLGLFTGDVSLLASILSFALTAGVDPLSRLAATRLSNLSPFAAPPPEMSPYAWQSLRSFLCARRAHVACTFGRRLVFKHTHRSGCRPDSLVEAWDEFRLEQLSSDQTPPLTEVPGSVFALADYACGACRVDLETLKREVRNDLRRVPRDILDPFPSSE